MRRSTSAWFLFLLSTAQWIGGHVCFDVLHMIEIQRKINAAEQVLADMVREEVGAKSTVQILKKEELTRRGDAYEDFVFFRETLEGKIYYTVERNHKTVKYITVPRVPIGDNPDAAHQQSLLKKLFTEFMLEASALPPAPARKPLTEVFCFAAPHSFLFTPSLLHPPDQA